jgi:hypothetical protein
MNPFIGVAPAAELVEVIEWARLAVALADVAAAGPAGGLVRGRSLHVLCAPVCDRIGIEFCAVWTRHILNRMAPPAQCARGYECIVHRSQQSSTFLSGITILEIVNIPNLRFAHLFSP